MSHLDESQVLPNLLADRAISTPDLVFLQQVDGRSLTYGELELLVRQWADGFAACSVQDGDTVVVMLDNMFESAITWLSTARLGGIEVQVNTAYLGSILVHVVNNSRAGVAVVGARYVERFVQVASELEFLETLIVVGEEAANEKATAQTLPFTLVPVAHFLSSAEAAPKLVRPAAHDTACILYTSGTTGPSKGVIIPWAQAHATATGCIPLDELGPDDAWYSPFPMFHMSGKLALYAAATFGGRFVLRDIFKTDEFWNDIREFQCTCTMLIGSTPAFVWNLPASSHDRDHPLRNVLMAPTPDEPDAFMDRFGFRISTVFNMTEISCPVMSGWDLGPKGSAGQLRPGYDVRIVDDRDYEVPRGTLGEIIVRSDEPWMLMAGYWQNPAATAEAWRNHWFHTGDAGMQDDNGYYYFVDRIKDAIRHRGENVSSMELEGIINDCPDVVESAAVGVPSEFGEEDIKVYVVPNRDPFEPEQLLEYLRSRVPRFMLPRYLVAVAGLPKTPTEKVRKHELRARTEDSVWDREVDGSSAGRRSR
ncbi:MAG: AMP-binding protein [Acidimicrobiales bacterium]|jgi:crotonobetaine/carnitine-CoA ligase